MAAQELSPLEIARRVRLHRFPLAHYHKMFEIGVLRFEENLQLLEGCVMRRPGRSARQLEAARRGQERLSRLTLSGWAVRASQLLTLPDSELVPDFVFVREGQADVGLVIEVSDTTLVCDRADKCRIYARAGIATYWIVNIPDRQVEVYTSPSGPAPAPAYASRQDYRPGQDVPLTLDGHAVALIPVGDLLP